MRRRGDDWPAAPWPPQVWQAFTNGHDQAQREQAYEWCEERGYNRLLVLWVIATHKRGSAGCPCPAHKSPGASFPSPAELERLWHRGRL